MRSAIVFGGTGQLGIAVAQELLSSGWSVTVVTREGRRPPQSVMAGGAALVDGTGKSRAQLIRDHGPVDGVFDPTAYNDADAHDLIAARDLCGALVAVSSASVYAAPDGRSLVEASQAGAGGNGEPVAEDAATVAPGPQGYSARKMAMEQALAGSGVAASILRPCAVYATHSSHPREWWFIKRALDGRQAIPVAYGARSVFHTSSARGIAQLTRLCLERPEARVLNAADRTALPVSALAAAIAAVTGLDIRLTPFEGAPIGPSHVGSTPWSTEHPLVLDTASAQALGWDGGEYGGQVGEVCRWVLDVARQGDWRETFSRFTQYGYDPFDYAAEDAVLP